METVSIVEVENRIVKVDRLLTQREWQEFLKRALRLHEQSSRTLKQALEDKQRLVEAARLAAEEAAKRQREREEQIAQTAAERARIEAEQKAEREARIAAYAAAKEKQEIEQRARKDAENHARELKEQQEKARRNRQNAVQQERERVAREEQERAEAETRRIADENHRCKIEYEAQAALFLIIGSDRLAERVLEAIIAGEVPHIDIKY
jgi:hypothetical protein